MVTGGITTDIIIKAMEEQGMARSLAEPNLVALSGDTASFLAGGEFPIPVPGALGTVTIEYKKYGVGLAFTPTVLSDGLINLKIEPEVSELDHDNPVSVRRHHDAAADRAPRLTTVELRDGQSFVIGGLLQNNSTNRSRAVALARRRAGARRVVPQRAIRRKKPISPSSSRRGSCARRGRATRSRRRSTRRCRPTTSTSS